MDGRTLIGVGLAAAALAVSGCGDGGGSSGGAGTAPVERTALEGAPPITGATDAVRIVAGGRTVPVRSREASEAGFACDLEILALDGASGRVTECTGSARGGRFVIASLRSPRGEAAALLCPAGDPPAYRVAATTGWRPAAAGRVFTIAPGRPPAGYLVAGGIPGGEVVLFFATFDDPCPKGFAVGRTRSLTSGARAIVAERADGSGAVCATVDDATHEVLLSRPARGQKCVYPDG